VVFCRNLLIYFDRVTQQRAIEALGRLLTPPGLLFVGPSETGLLLDLGFVPAGIPLAFAFRQAGTPAPKPRPKRTPAAAAIAAKPDQNPAKRASIAKPASIAAPQSKAADKTEAAAAENWIEQARRLANEGKLVEALQCCEHNLRSQPASAETFHLLGLLHDAAGRVREAAEHYRKALYLDPRHPEALIHLAVALQTQGDARGAQRLLERANRASGPDASKGSG
jgi:chemotaxis protein methyltransferase WspC